MSFTDNTTARRDITELKQNISFVLHIILDQLFRQDKLVL